MAISDNDPRLERCGFAKLEGESGFEFFIRKYEITLGRNSKAADVDVMIGDNRNVSRQHAKIVYNFDRRCFELIVLGKNGVHVGSSLYTHESPPCPLNTQDRISVGDKSFWFLLPQSASSIHPRRKRKASHAALPVDSGPSVAAAAPSQPPAPQAAAGQPAEKRMHTEGSHAAPTQPALPQATTSMGPASHGNSSAQAPQQHADSEAAAPPSQPAAVPQQAQGQAQPAPMPPAAQQQHQLPGSSDAVMDENALGASFIDSAA